MPEEPTRPAEERRGASAGPACGYSRPAAPSPAEATAQAPGSRPRSSYRLSSHLAKSFPSLHELLHHTRRRQPHRTVAAGIVRSAVVDLEFVERHGGEPAAQLRQLGGSELFPAPGLEPASHRKRG